MSVGKACSGRFTLVTFVATIFTCAFVLEAFKKALHRYGQFFAIGKGSRRVEELAGSSDELLFPAPSAIHGFGEERRSSSRQFFKSSRQPVIRWRVRGCGRVRRELSLRRMDCRPIRTPSRGIKGFLFIRYYEGRNSSIPPQRLRHEFFDSHFSFGHETCTRGLGRSKVPLFFWVFDNDGWSVHKIKEGFHIFFIPRFCEVVLGCHREAEG
jgi:hypothetical protein